MNKNCTQLSRSKVVAKMYLFMLKRTLLCTKNVLNNHFRHSISSTYYFLSYSGRPLQRKRLYRVAHRKRTGNYNYQENILARKPETRQLGLSWGELKRCSPNFILLGGWSILNSIQMGKRFKWYLLKRAFDSLYFSVRCTCSYH